MPAVWHTNQSIECPAVADPSKDSSTAKQTLGGYAAERKRLPDYSLNARSP